MKNTFLALCILAFGFASCQNNQESTSATSANTLYDTTTIVDMHTSQSSLDWNGIYEGVLPCADCPGIKTTIELDTNNTFTQHLEYLERNTEFNATGKIEWHKDGNNITLISKDGERQQFKVREGSLVMLNADGEESTGPFAEHFVLNKKD